jgi:hypothetical protein
LKTSLSSGLRSTASGLALLFGLLLLLPAPAGGQMLEPEPVEIRNIEVKFTGVANISEAVVPMGIRRSRTSA